MNEDEGKANDGLAQACWAIISGMLADEAARSPNNRARIIDMLDRSLLALDMRQKASVDRASLETARQTITMLLNLLAQDQRRAGAE
jgi:hypothetical protein